MLFFVPEIKAVEEARTDTKILRQSPTITYEKDSWQLTQQ